MKAYTDIEQSRKLAEILPIESADMFWMHVEEKSPKIDFWKVETIQRNFKPYSMDIPCWSLAALLEQFEDTAGLAKDYGLWFCYDNRKSYCSKHYDNPVDAAFELILMLHELELL